MTHDLPQAGGCYVVEKDGTLKRDEVTHAAEQRKAAELKASGAKATTKAKE